MDLRVASIFSKSYCAKEIFYIELFQILGDVEVIEEFIRGKEGKFQSLRQVGLSRCTPVVDRTFERHIGDSTIFLARFHPNLEVEHPRGMARTSNLSSPSTNLTRGLVARWLLRLPPAAKALYIYKHPCLLRYPNLGPTARLSASLTTVPDG
ncbi:hypothetical protein TNCV_815731 [Trichonephila clavipes]|nr:hypothetical protein TNCV_815731 [Trichonephila clavipes]